MTTAAAISPLVGVQPFSNSSLIAVEVATSATGYQPLIPLGEMTDFVDPYWGGVRCIRLSIPVSTAVLVGNLSTVTSAFGYVAVPNTANLGQNVAVAANSIPSNATFVQYAWFVVSGKYPVLSTASVAADTALGIAAAGQAGAISAGKQLLSSRVQIAATTTVVKANTLTVNGSPNLRVSNSDGWFVGLALTGTGIPASTAIGSISADGTIIGMVSTGTTTAQNATATGAVSVTGTYNDATRFWNVATFGNMFAQGQIT